MEEMWLGSKNIIKVECDIKGVNPEVYMELKHLKNLKKMILPGIVLIIK